VWRLAAAIVIFSVIAFASFLPCAYTDFGCEDERLQPIDHCSLDLCGRLASDRAGRLRLLTCLPDRCRSISTPCPIRSRISGSATSALACRLIAEETEKWVKVVKFAGLTPE
jgi:hypothetical protein